MGTGPRVVLRGPCACGCLLALVLLHAAVWLGGRVLKRSVQPVTAVDLRESATRARTADAETALDARFEHAALVRSYGQMRQAHARTVALLVRDPKFAKWGRVPASAARMEAEWRAYKKRAGINGDEDWHALLRQSQALAVTVTRRADLPPQSAGAAHLAHGYILLGAGLPREALSAASEARTRGADALSMALLEADAFADLRRYGDAEARMRTARALVGAWASQGPEWEVRFWWALRRPAAQRRMERNWAARRRAVARNLGMTISSEIAVLQGLQRAQRRSSR